MKIEAGKFYRTRDGRKVGPMMMSCHGDEGGFVSDEHCLYRRDGTFGYGDVVCPSFDIIAEWTEALHKSDCALHNMPAMPNGDCDCGPVRTVTRKEIVPGAYGRVMVSKSITDASHICVELTGGIAFSRAELTAAIDTLTQIRDAMQEGWE
jgi:hypothetical protein